MNKTSLTWLKEASIISLQNGLIYLGYGAYKCFSSLSELDAQKPAFYQPDFFLRSSTPWIQYDKWFQLSLREFEREIDEQPLGAEILWKIENENLFNDAFKSLQKSFKDSSLEKAVPYVFAHSHEQMSTSRLLNSLKKAVKYIQAYPGYLYGYWDENSGVLGVTPEILFTHHIKEPTLLKTMALAGTQKNDQGGVPLEKNEKELHEHQLVIKGISKTLQSLGKVTVGETSVLNLPTLKHLLTLIELTLDKPFDFVSTIRFLHPTPALGAFPREQGWQWLENYQEKLDRKNFGAPFGMHFGSKGLSTCLVAIRQVQWTSQGMRIGAGCGIVKKSQLLKEWQEIQLKIRAIRNLLDL